jgi:hypothetical protein
MRKYNAKRPDADKSHRCVFSASLAPRPTGSALCADLSEEDKELYSAEQHEDLGRISPVVGTDREQTELFTHYVRGILSVISANSWLEEEALGLLHRSDGVRAMLPKKDTDGFCNSLT